MQLKLDDVFTIEGETYCWVLTSTINKGVNKEGAPIIAVNRSYHANLKQALEAYVDESVKLIGVGSGLTIAKECVAILGKIEKTIAEFPLPDRK